jgi:hypothetical protein
MTDNIVAKIQSVIQTTLHRKFYIEQHESYESGKGLYAPAYIYVWKLNQTVLELDFWAVKFVFFPRWDLNSHPWYTAAPIA